jgi:hypothetical protein
MKKKKLEEILKILDKLETISNNMSNTIYYLKKDIEREFKE